MELKLSRSKNGKPRHPKSEEMTLRLAQRFQIDEGAKCYDDLPNGVKNLYSHFSYQEIVRPLICMDKKENPSISYEALANRYGISKVGIYKMILTWIGKD